MGCLKTSIIASHGDMAAAQLWITVLLLACLLAPGLTFSSSLLINSNLNPCGAGVSPTQCVCPNGTQYSVSNLATRISACGLFSGPPTCTCPSGTSFQPTLATVFSSFLGAFG